MASLPRRVQKLAENLGIAPEQVRELMSDNSRQAAVIVQEALQRFIDQIAETSESGALSGYTAKIDEGDFEMVSLRKSGIDIVGQFKYLVYVEASKHHQDLDINVFDILDAGRPSLHYKKTSVYPLWQAKEEGSEGDRVLSTGAGGKIARAVPVNVSAIRHEPRKPYYAVPFDGYLQFTHGPIRGVAAKHLYERALKAAKDALAGSGFKQWDVIYVGPEGTK